MRLKPPEDAEVNRARSDATLPCELLRLSVLGTTAGVRGALAQTRQTLSVLHIPEEDLGTIEIVLAEVLNNIVEHAYPEDLAGPIDLEILKVPEGCHFCISDRGVPMPEGRPPSPMPHNLDVDPQDLPEGGFGWTLIHMLSTDLDYCHSEGRNVLTFGIPASTGPVG